MTKDELNRLFDYSSWANHRVLRGAATLSSEDFRRDLGGSHGGVRGTLVHMLFAEWEGKAFEAPLWQLAQHLANHGSYHRGQVVHILRSLGAPVVSTDMVLWDRERTSRGA